MRRIADGEFAGNREYITVPKLTASNCDLVLAGRRPLATAVIDVAGQHSGTRRHQSADVHARSGQEQEADPIQPVLHDRVRHDRRG
jgi:hypothetical protein